jgi:hypothetical protein
VGDTVAGNEEINKVELSGRYGGIPNMINYIWNLGCT